MSVLSALSVSTLAMLNQSTALHQIGTNVSNMQTGGYKRSDVQFQSLLGNQMFGEKDQGGNVPIISQRIDTQGLLTSTSSSLDLAISGSGFFVTSTDFAATDLVYTRDGSFRQSAVNDVTVTDPISGDVFVTKDAYLVDKNGNFVLGYPINADGTFPTTGPPAPMRVDKNAFSALGFPTTSAELGVNLNSNAALISNHLTAVSDFDDAGIKTEGMEVFTINFVDSEGNRKEARLNFTKNDINLWDVSSTYQGTPTAQVDTVTLTGTIDPGDVFRVTVGNTQTSHTAVAGDTIASITASLIANMNANVLVSAQATATAGPTPGTIVLTAAVPGTAFTTTTDSTHGPGTAQVDTLTIAGTVEAGDVYELTVGGSTVSYNVTGGEGSLPAVVSGFVAIINGSSSVNTSVLASIGTGPGEITLTSRLSGTPFTATTRVLDTSSTAQVDTATIAGSIMEIGDTYSVTINGTTVPYTVDGTEGGLAGVRTALRGVINAHPVLGTVVTATDGGPAGDLIITAQVPGTAFTSAVGATNGGVTPDNTAVIAPTTANAVGGSTNTSVLANTTPNVTPTNDSTTSSVITTANDAGLVTSAVTQIPFLGDGRAGTATGGGVTPPADLSFAFSFPATGGDPASTATFTLDVSEMTQLANKFQLQFYSDDGRENALIQEVGFDSEGHVLGFFSNGRSQSLYQIPLAKFPNPNALESLSGMTFRETERSGAVTIETVNASGIATFVPGTIEISNVNLVDEFTAIIKTQQAYNSSANAFKTIDEMFETLLQTKR